MTTAQVVIDAVRAELNDDLTAKRYSDATLLSYLTIAQRELVKYKPEAYANADTFVFTTSDARQRLNPASYYAVLRVDANLDTSGVPPYPTGRAIRTVERDALDTFYVAWPVSSGTAGANGQRYKVAAMDSADPLAFWLFPQPEVGHGVSLTTVKIPPAMGTVGSTLPLNDVYIPALVQYICHAALRSEERAESAETSSKYLDAFLALLGKTRATLRQVGPEQPRAPEARQ